MGKKKETESNAYVQTQSNLLYDYLDEEMDDEESQVRQPPHLASDARWTRVPTTPDSE